MEAAVRVWGGIVAVLVLACGGPEALPPAPRAATIEIIGPPDLADVPVGTSADYRVEVRDAAGAVLPTPAGVRWHLCCWTGTSTARDSAFARLLPLPNGGVRLEALDVGPVGRLVVELGDTSSGRLEASRRFQLARVPPPLARLEFVGAPSVRATRTVLIPYHAFDSAGRVIDVGDNQSWWGALPWTTSDPAIAEVSSGGAGAISVTGRAAGTVTIRSARPGVAGSVTVTVTPPPAPPPPSGALPAVTLDSTRWARLDGGMTESCGLRAGGDVLCWGGDDTNEFGSSGTPDPAIVPKRVPLPAAVDVFATGGAFGNSRGCAAGGATLYCWLLTFDGTPNDVGAFSLPSTAASERITAVALGAAHACVVTDAAKIYCRGGNHAAQLGPGGGFEPCGIGATVLACRFSLGVVDTPLRFAAVATGGQFTCALTTDGAAYCWGAAALGAPPPPGETCSFFAAPPGHVIEVPCRRTPLAVAASERFTSIAARGDGVCAVRVDRGVMCWRGDAAPAVVPGVLSTRSIAVGEQHACALDDAGIVRCWGANAALQLGVGGVDSSATPVVVPLVGPSDAIAAGSFHTCRLGGDGRATCWGLQRSGELGRPRW